MTAELIAASAFLLPILGLLTVLKAVKLEDFPVDRRLSPSDVGWAALIYGALYGLSRTGVVGLGVSMCFGTMFFVALWLDAVLFRVFTIELGPGGVGSIVLSVLYSELAELTTARRNDDGGFSANAADRGR